MQYKVMRATSASGRKLKPGDVVELTAPDAATLLGLGKVAKVEAGARSSSSTAPAPEREAGVEVTSGAATERAGRSSSPRRGRRSSSSS